LFETELTRLQFLFPHYNINPSAATTAPTATQRQLAPLNLPTAALFLVSDVWLAAAVPVALPDALPVNEVVPPGVAVDMTLATVGEDLVLAAVVLVAASVAAAAAAAVVVAEEASVMKPKATADAGTVKLLRNEVPSKPEPPSDITHAADELESTILQPRE
jgi:hypothetical protein